MTYLCTNTGIQPYQKKLTTKGIYLQEHVLYLQVGTYPISIGRLSSFWARV